MAHLKSSEGLGNKPQRIKLGDDTRPSSAAGAGALRWNSDQLQSSTGVEWKSHATAYVDWAQNFLANAGAPVYSHELTARAYDTNSGIVTGTNWYDGFWTDECTTGGLIHSKNGVPDAYGDNYFVWAFNYAVQFKSFQYRGRNHPTAAYFGNGRLSGGNSSTGPWTTLVTQGEVGQCDDSSVTNFTSTTTYSHMRWDMWGAASGYQVTNWLKIQVYGVRR